jgi:hypothetical protein
MKRKRKSESGERKAESGGRKGILTADLKGADEKQRLHRVSPHRQTPKEENGDPAFAKATAWQAEVGKDF